MKREPTRARRTWQASYGLGLTHFLRWVGRRCRHGRAEHAECFYCDLRNLARQYRDEVLR